METDAMTGAEFARRHHVTMRATGGELDQDAQGWDHHAWHVTLTMYDKRVTSTYRMGTGHKGKRPNVGEVLESLVMDAHAADESFPDFCADFGYDEDSRKALATWHACRKIREDLENWAGRQFPSLLTVQDA